jgi:hypothetical protein
MQSTKQAPFVSNVEAYTMTDSFMENLTSKKLPQETFDEFGKNTRGISSNIMRKIVYDGKGLRNKGKGILIPIISQQRPEHEGLKFSGQ